LAELAAQLHERISGEAGQAMTPLALLQAPKLHRGGAILFSARAKHPDALMVLARLGNGEYSPAVLVTRRRREDLEQELRGDVAVVTLKSPSVAEGFLATNSVLAMTVALLRAALGDDVLPDEVPVGAKSFNDLTPRERLLVIFPPSLACVAMDVETRCSELGLAAVQLADLRNIAHGRHVGLSRLASITTVLVLSDRENGPLAQSVSGTLEGSGAEIVRWHVDLPWPPAVIALLYASMQLAGRLGAAQDVDPGRPKVPLFGRRLYRLPLRRLLARRPATPVECKVGALGGGMASSLDLQARCASAFEAWSADLADLRLRGLVLDYDGTVCETTKRFDPPHEDVQAALLRVLQSGLHLGFASGRGKSLHKGLRSWVPEPLWQVVTVGLYNGAVCGALADELLDITEPTALMREVTARLNDLPFRDLLQLSARSGQVTVETAAGSFFHGGRLAVLINEAVARVPGLPVKVVASGHSVDVVANDTSKVLVLDRVRGSATGEVVAVGDQGDIGGNDFELLSATPWSVSVNRCSGDPSRCWYVDPAGRRGPSALVALLDALELYDGSAKLDVRRISKRVVNRA
jgi:hypothetical protein